MKLKEKLQDLQRKYKKITAYKYAYNVKADLTKTVNRIVVYYLLFEEQHGYSIMKFVYKRRPKTIKQWREFLETESDDVFVGKVLPAINVKYGSNWIFKDLILWSVENALGKTDDSDTSKAGNKTKRAGKK